MRNPKVKLGDAVCITLRDHAMGPYPQESLLFEVFGRVVKITKTDVVIAYFVSPDKAIDENTETVVVVRDAIEKVRKLK